MAVKRVTGHAPALLGVGQARKRVQDRVQVGANEQAVPLGVVADVDDDRQIAGSQDLLQAVGDLRPSGPAG